MKEAKRKRNERMKKVHDRIGLYKEGLLARESRDQLLVTQVSNTMPSASKAFSDFFKGTHNILNQTKSTAGLQTSLTEEKSLIDMYMNMKDTYKTSLDFKEQEIGFTEPDIPEKKPDPQLRYSAIYNLHPPKEGIIVKTVYNIESH